MTPRKNRTEIFEDVIYYCAIPMDTEKLYDKVTRYIQVKHSLSGPELSGLVLEWDLIRPIGRPSYRAMVLSLDSRLKKYFSQIQICLIGS